MERLFADILSMQRTLQGMLWRQALEMFDWALPCDAEDWRCSAATSSAF